MTKKEVATPTQEEFDALKQKVEKIENDLKALKEHYKFHQKDQTVVIERYLNKHEMG